MEVFSKQGFRCPRCKGDLAGDYSLKCTLCGAVYLVKDDIIDFRCHRKDYYYNPIPQNDMESLVHGMEKRSWEATVRSFLTQVDYNPDWLDNLVGDGRYAWKTLLNLNSDTVLLDLGCGLGNLTHNIAPHVGKVYAVDLTHRRLEFCRNRFRKFNPTDNIRLAAAGDARFLPFSDNLFDCVVLSGVLEWVGEGRDSWGRSGGKVSRAWHMVLSCFGANSARAMQRLFLKEIRRILKPTGQLFIAIENRLSHAYFKTRPDHHSDLMYGSLLPRILANVYSIVVRKSPYRTYTYSAWGYKKLLKEAGFRHFDIFGLMPGYTHLQELFPVEADQVRWKPSKPLGMKDRIKRSKSFVPAYGIVAAASYTGQTSLHSRLLTQIEQTIPEPYRGNHITVNQYEVTYKDKGIIFGSIVDQSIVIKLPFNAPSLVEEQHGLTVFRFMEQHPTVALSYRPRILCHGIFQGMHYFVEERMKGNALAKSLPLQGSSHYLTAISGLLEQINQSLPAPQPFIGDVYGDNVLQPLELLSQAIEDHKIPKALGCYFHARLFGTGISLGLRHGDFSVNNILVENGQISGILDWGKSTPKGIPLLDALNYLDSVQRGLAPEQSLRQTIPLLASLQSALPDEKEFLSQQYARCHIDPSQHRAWVYLYWLQHVSNQLPYRLIYDMRAIRQNILLIAEELLANDLHRTF